MGLPAFLKACNLEASNDATFRKEQAEALEQNIEKARARILVDDEGNALLPAVLGHALHTQFETTIKAIETWKANSDPAQHNSLLMQCSIEYTALMKRVDIADDENGYDAAIKLRDEYADIIHTHNLYFSPSSDTDHRQQGDSPQP